MNVVLANELQRTIALVVLGQILGHCQNPSLAPALAAVKGGTAMRLRFGPDGSRFSRDFDLARHSSLNEFTHAFSVALAVGWCGFTGELSRSRSFPKPTGVPPQYVMQSYVVKLYYRGPRSFFMKVDVEVGADELDDTVETQPLLDPGVVDLFTCLGLPAPDPIHVIRDDHQIAQKLHAVSGKGSERAHDLIDLQLLAASCSVSDDQVLDTCKRLFQFRQVQEWPPVIEMGVAWETLYAHQVGDLPVHQTAPDAVEWCNRYIARLTHAERNSDT
jgi:hypothetical protein